MRAIGCADGTKAFSLLACNCAAGTPCALVSDRREPGASGCALAPLSDGLTGALAVVAAAFRSAAVALGLTGPVLVGCWGGATFG